MSARIRAYVRQHHLALVCLFLILTGGTAYGTHPGGANTISTGDIINDQVFTQDLANNNMTSLDIRDDTLGSGGLQAIDLRDDSVGTSEITDDAVGFHEIADNAVSSSEILFGAVGADEISNDSVGAAEIAVGAVGAAEIGDGAVGAAEIGDGAVGAAEIGDDLVDRADPFPTLVAGGGAHNGAYNVESSTALCHVGEELIGGYGRWDPNDLSTGDHELVIGQVRLDHAADSVTVDGGNDSGVDHTLAAVATCLPV